MRGFAIAASLGLLLSAVPGVAAQGAQTKPTQAKPAQTPPPPAQATPAPAPPAAQPPPPFPQGAKFAYVNIQRIAGESREGRVSSSRVQALIQKKESEGAEKAKSLQANQQKLQQSGTVMSDTARAQLEKEIERQQIETQRFQQDAQAEINELQGELQSDFQRKLLPVLQQLAQEKGLEILFSAADAGIVWAEPGLDLTAEAIKKLDAAAPKP
jgi:Skp family chaperone for outer membrane proteins